MSTATTPLVRIPIRLDRDLRSKVEQAAKRDHRSMNGWIGAKLREAVETQPVSGLVPV